MTGSISLALVAMGAQVKFKMVVSSPSPMRMCLAELAAQTHGQLSFKEVKSLWCRVTLEVRPAERLRPEAP